MSGIAAEIQKAIYGALAADEPLSYLVSGIYDHVPPESVFPYIVIGEDTLIDFDTDNSTGAESTCTIHIWSEYRGRAEAKGIMDAVYDILHRKPPAVDGFDALDCVCEYQDVLVDPDGLTRHGVMRFRVTIDKQET